MDEVIEGPLASDGGRIFVATRQGAVRALDPSGEQVWRRDGPPGRIAATTGALLLREEDGTIVSLDPATGVTRWTANSGVLGELPPTIDRDRIFVAGRGLAALDLATGRLLWSQPGSPTVSQPLAHGNWVLAGEGDGALRCRDRASGAVVWAYRTREPLVAPPVVDQDGRVFLGTTDRRIQALTLRKGGQRWRWKVGADVQHTGVVFRDAVLFAAFDDVLYALKRKNGHLAWRTPLPSRPLSPPVLAGGAVLLACYESEVLGFNARTGKRLGGLKTPAEIRTPPLLVDDRLYVGLRDRTVVAYRLDMTPAAPETPRPPAQPGTRRRP
jgi:outer membrane protein assembly factor BamB